jgi:hypothetical protein
MDFEAAIRRKRNMDIRKCGPGDCLTLAKLNKQLIEDEKSDNTMNLYELEQRMKSFISGSLEAVFFMDCQEIFAMP